MTGVIIGAAVALLCLIWGIILISGHGFGMISGYNTMSKAEREKVNAEALGKAVGVYTAAIGVIAGVMCAIPVLWLIIMLSALVLIVTIPFLIWVNKSPKFRCSNRVPQDKERPQ